MQLEANNWYLGNHSLFIDSTIWCDENFFKADQMTLESEWRYNVSKIAQKDKRVAGQQQLLLVYNLPVCGKRLCIPQFL